MNALTKQIKDARHTLVEARIILQHAEEEQGDYETFLITGCDYNSLGSNAKAREVAFDKIKQDNEQYRQLTAHVREGHEYVDRAEVELECLFDERREQENATWAGLVDYLRGKIDHIHHAPTQAARHSARVAAIDAVMEKIEATRQAAQAPLPGDSGNGDEPPIDDEECPF